MPVACIKPLIAAGCGQQAAGQHVGRADTGSRVQTTPEQADSSAGRACWHGLTTNCTVDARRGMSADGAALGRGSSLSEQLWCLGCLVTSKRAFSLSRSCYTRSCRRACPGGLPQPHRGLTPTTSASVSIEGEHCHRTEAARGLGHMFLTRPCLARVNWGLAACWSGDS